MGIQEQAKAQRKGRWAEDGKIQPIRNITWNFDDPRTLINKYNHKRVEAIVEQVIILMFLRNTINKFYPKKTYLGT